MQGSQVKLTVAIASGILALISNACSLLNLGDSDGDNSLLLAAGIAIGASRPGPEIINGPANCNSDFFTAVSHAAVFSPGSVQHIADASWGNYCVFRLESTTAGTYDLEIMPSSDTEISVSAGYQGTQPSHVNEYRYHKDQNSIAGSTESIDNVPLSIGGYRYVWVKVNLENSTCNYGQCSFDLSVTLNTSVTNHCSSDISLALANFQTFTPGNQQSVSDASPGDYCVYRVNASTTDLYNITANPDTDVDLYVRNQIRNAVPSNAADAKYVQDEGKLGITEVESNLPFSNGDYRYVWTYIISSPAGLCAPGTCGFTLDTVPTGTGTTNLGTASETNCDITVDAPPGSVSNVSGNLVLTGTLNAASGCQWIRWTADSAGKWYFTLSMESADDLDLYTTLIGDLTPPVAVSNVLFPLVGIGVKESVAGPQTAGTFYYMILRARSCMMSTCSYTLFIHKTD